MGDLVVSRRAVTRAIFTTPVLALPVASTASVSPSHLLTSNGMTEAIEAFRAAAQAAERHIREIYSPAWSAWRAAAARIPHVTTTASMRGWASFDYLTTAEPGMVNMAHAIMKEADPDNLRDFEIAAAELVEAQAVRKAESDRLAIEFNVDALSDEGDRLADIRDNAITSVEDFPVTSLSDLIAKTEIIAEIEGLIEPEKLLVDLHRIAGRA